jgi:hypothetical protein
VYARLYLQDVDRGPLRTTRIVKLLSAITGFACLGMHKLEGVLLAAAGKDASKLRARWTASHIAVLRRADQES